MTARSDGPVPGLTALWSHDPVTAGPYRLLGRLGAGGQGVVYLGEDDRGHRVAVKMIHIDLSDPRARSQFLREITAARRVAPFCTAQVLSADVDGEQPYVVSEFIEGPSLYRHVREQGPIGGNALHRLAVGTATALAAIHRSDVVHCDLKPDNVVLGRDGPRVIDFGIARALGVTETASSRVMGTVAYMAPERFQNDAVTPACDIFAWAGTIAFAAGGQPPFGTGSLFAVMHRIVHAPPELPPLPPGLDELIRQCLEKDPARRPEAEQVLIRLLRQDARVTGPLVPETVLQVGNDTAGAPTPNQPLPVPSARSAPSAVTAGPPVAPGPTRTVLDQPAAAPSVPPVPSSVLPPSSDPLAATVPAVVSDPAAPPWPAPGPPGPPAGPAGTGPGARLRREAADPWGISTAIFLGLVGAAAGYVGSVDVVTAGVTGLAVFVVVYLVRLLVAAALGDRPDRS